MIDRRIDAESHRQLSLLCLAQSGDNEAVKKQMTQWEKENE